MAKQQQENLNFAADRMYDAIRSLLAAESPTEFARAIMAQKQAANDYDAAMSSPTPELAARVRRTT